MSIFKAISEFLESIFKRSSPEVQKKQQMKKIEAELHSFSPVLYADGKLQPNFAEAINSLYRNTKLLDDLFLRTVSSIDNQRQHRFEAQLIVTGYTPDQQQLLESLEYDRRKQEIREEARNPDRVYMRHRKTMENLMRELNTENFKRMDADLLQLRQFVDFCHISFVPVLQVFDPNYQSQDPLYEPRYTPVAISKVSNLLEDLYYQASGLKITTSTADLVIALAELIKGNELTPDEQDKYLSAMKKINFVISRILPTDRIKTMLRFAKQDLEYEPKVASYTGSPRQEFANLFQSKFSAEELRIKSELQDEQISNDVSALFKNLPLDELDGYNSSMNELLIKSTSLNFKYILPMKIMKTFLRIYISPSLKALLNDIVIEGFFNNPNYKSDFSTLVYEIFGADNEIKDFEETFGDGKPNSIAVMKGYIQDSHKDKDFYRKLEKMVGDVNTLAQKILQSLSTSLFMVYKYLGDLLEDARKPSSEIISNLKVLMFSSRNRDNTNLLDTQYADWKIFFDIMRNYVIINSSE